MKQEEKLEEAKRLYKTANADQRYVLESLFSELKESEDERIRKELIKHLRDGAEGYIPAGNAEDYTRWLSWLEKQGNTNETIDRDKFTQGVLRGAAINLITWIDYNAAEGNMCLSNVQCKEIENALVRGDWNKIYAYMKKKLEKQDEKKHIFDFNANNWCVSKVDGKIHNIYNVGVEPKFKVGDWIIFNEHHTSVYQVEKIQGLRYYLRHYNGGSMSVPIDSQLIRLWTIQDAKDGDVLTVNGKPFIYYHTDEYKGNYCCIDNIGCFRTNIRFSFEGNCILPATKEQRDLLFQKMKDAGYEWDVDKKELKKIEKQGEPKWSDNDEELLQHCCGAIHAADYYTLEDKEEMENWLKTIKQRMEE